MIHLGHVSLVSGEQDRRVLSPENSGYLFLSIVIFHYPT